MSFKAGIYRHYKGAYYEAFVTARHSETEEELVVYRCLYGDFSWWVRPLTMFMENIELDNQAQARFAFVCEADAESLSKYSEG